MQQWRPHRTDEFEADLRDACGKDRSLRSRAEKKVNKLLENPDRPRGGKTGGLAGLRAEPVNPYVIIYSFEITPENPPGIVHFRGFWHHNDRRYDP
jgi:mRNA-degrading endonuclease RelE of RelBE toxin-antitoxin system